MARKKISLAFFSLILIVLLLQIALSEGPAATWYGGAYIGSNTTTTGANVSAWINNRAVASFIVGVNYCGSGCTTPTYILDVPCSEGDSVTLAIYNVTNSSKTCNTGIKTPLNLTITQLANSAICAYSAACSGGYCCSGATEYNGNGVGACQATACSAPAPTPSGDSGGGGGGGGGGGVVSQSKYTGSIPADESKTVSFTKEELKITSVEVTTTEAVANIGITVKESTAPAANLAIEAEEGKAYKYLEITKTVEDKSIKQVKISFKVEKSWFETNGLNPATTVLKKLVNNVWQDLPTSKVSEDGTYVYFEATSETLSKFAITAQKIGAVVTPPAEGEEVKPCGDAVCNAAAGENCATCVQDCTCKSGEECKAGICQAVPKSTITKPRVKIELLVKIASIILIAIILIVAIILLSKRKK